MNDADRDIDAHSPVEIARLAERVGIAKASTNTLTLLVLALLAGAFISLGAMSYLVVTTNTGLGFGVTRLLGGLSFCLGLILVIVAGAELFTGNNLVAIAWASRRISTAALLRNWVLSYFGNVCGCLATVGLAWCANIAALNDGAVGATALHVAAAKTALTLGEAFARGVLCNVLVCLAVWLAMGARSVTDKILAVVFPVTAFVALGFEHSIANWFFLPYALVLEGQGAVTINAAAINLAVVTAGNIVGGTLLVAGVYWLAYLRGARTPEETRSGS